MLRYINTDVLIKNEIDAHQYFILYMLLAKQYDLLDEYLNSSKTMNRFEEDMKYLESKNLVFNESLSPIYAAKNFKVHSNFISTLGNYNNFEELFFKFPLKVRRPDGKWDYLRRDRKTLEQIYAIIVKDSRDAHDHIIKCLEYELDMKEKEGSMPYMKRMLQWLSDKEWLNYEDIVDDVSYTKEKYSYGTNIE